jgi:hypothetical protein
VLYRQPLRTWDAEDMGRSDIEPSPLPILLIMVWTKIPDVQLDCKTSDDQTLFQCCLKALDKLLDS